jgi:uncharacterized membrane protein
MTWIILIAASAVIITVTQVVFRAQGVTVASYVWYALGAVAGTGWMLPIAYARAPSFAQPYFLSQALIMVFGLAASALYFSEALTPGQWAGIALTALGAVLIAY